uniref:Uncharacterized protein n=1 Tax=Solanum tuberosum TaxID=4113 RepID=M1DJF7_SOLTU
MNPFQIRLVDPLGSSGPILLAGYRMLWQREIQVIRINIQRLVDPVEQLRVSESQAKGSLGTSDDLRVPVPPRV